MYTRLFVFDFCQLTVLLRARDKWLQLAYVQKSSKLQFQSSGLFHLSGHLEICCDQRGLDNRGSPVAGLLQCTNLKLFTLLAIWQ